MPFILILLAGTVMIFGNFTGAKAQSGDKPAAVNEKTAIFAAGCFWCIEKDYEKHDGVIKAISGYSGGENDNPTYENHPGHLEVVRVHYDANKMGYKDLLEIFWANVDPLDARGQFCDKGHSYLSAIFYGNDEEKALAEESAQKVADLLNTNDIATAIRPAETFWDAEDYHQDYYKKNPNRYGFYRWRCGRDSRLEELWGDKALKRLDIF